MPPIKIRFFSSFGPESGCIEAYTRVSELNKDPLFNKAYCFVTTNDYTHAIILNTAMPSDLKIPKENVVGIAFEPIQFLGLSQKFIEYAKKHIGTYYIGEKPDYLPDLFKENYGYMWHMTPLTREPVKKNIISIMVSDKTLAEGHRYRHTLCSKILQSKLPIDIYGRGCKFYSFLNDPRVKGNFNGDEPYLSYVYHIAIENYKTPHYFSEKITNTLLCGTVPVYMGCANIDTYFPNQIIHLSGDVAKDMVLLENICTNPEQYKKQINVDEVKKTISFTHLIKKMGWV
jgi:hypothetical protein